MDRWCFLDSDGKLHHWVKRYDLELPPYVDRRGNYKYDKTRLEFFVTGGSAELISLQEDYNEWVRLRGIPDAVPIPSDGCLNKRTLKIPALRMEGALKALWRLFQADCREAAAHKFMKFGRCSFAIEVNQDFEPRWSRDPPPQFHPAGPDDDQCVTAKADGRLLGDCFYPDKTIHGRAMAMQRAWAELKRFESKVDAVEPFAPCSNCSGPWRQEIAPDHLEADMLPEGLLKELAAAQRQAQSALDEAVRSEEAARP